MCSSANSIMAHYLFAESPPSRPVYSEQVGMRSWCKKYIYIYIFGSKIWVRGVGTILPIPASIILFLFLCLCFNTRGIQLKPVLNPKNYDGPRVLEPEVGRAAPREEKGDEEIDVLEISLYRIYKLLTSLSSANSPSITPAISSVTSDTSYDGWWPTIPEPGHNS